MREALLAGVCVLACGCARGEMAPRAPVSGGAAMEDATAAHGFAAWERAILTDLAAVDPRLSLRLRIVPSESQVERATLGAILAEDGDLRVVEGRADLFSFDGRARALDALLARASVPPRAPASGDERAFEIAETELLSRFLAEERARVSEERRLPWSGSELLRGVVATWTLPREMSAQRERDAWLAARLDAVRTSVGGGALPVVGMTELDDALDPLEHLTEPSGFSLSEAAIVRLRVTLGTGPSGPSAGLGWEALDERLAVHLGLHTPEVALRTEIQRTEARLRDEAVALLSSLPKDGERAARRAATEILLVEGACDGRGGPSLVRTVAPPPERSPVCGALRAIADANGPTEDLAALIAVHDAVVLSQWALAIHVDHRDAEQAPEGHSLLGDVPPERVAHLIRFAAARPVACLAVARMASLLDAEGAEGRKARAKWWLEFGDAPLDLVEKEMGTLSAGRMPAGVKPASRGLSP